MLAGERKCDTMGHMKTVNVRELHERTGKLVDLAAEGHEVLVLKRGAPVAKLVPSATRSKRRVLPDRSALLARFPRLPGDSSRFLEEDRS